MLNSEAANHEHHCNICFTDIYMIFSLCVTFFIVAGEGKRRKLKKTIKKNLHISFSSWFSWQLLIKYFTVLFFLCKIYSQIQPLPSSAFSFILYTWTIAHLHLPDASPVSLSDQFTMKSKVVEVTGMGKTDRYELCIYLFTLAFICPPQSPSPSSNFCFS